MTATHAQIRSRLVAAKLGALADAVLAKTRPEVRITRTPTAQLALGESRLGGAPDLPHGLAWPTSETGEPLPFVAQLDLADLAPHQDVLPRAGTVWLFADQQIDAGEVGDYPVVASACLFAPAGTPLVRAAPAQTSETFAPATLAFASELGLPAAGEIDLPDEHWQAYAKIAEHFGQAEPRHASLARSEYGSIADVPPEGYVSLLRVDTDDELGTHWGDAAWITFAIRATDLAQQRFGATLAFRWIG